MFGRARLVLGLPGDFVAELGYTPPLTLDGVQPLDLFAFSIGRRIFDDGRVSFSVRAFGQHGRAHGDITCPASLAGNADREQNPFGCQAPSDDHVRLNYYGVDGISEWTARPWHAHASLGIARTEFAVQVDALTFDEHDRSYLVARGHLPFTTIGASLDLDPSWSVKSAEVLYVPLRVQRELDGPVENNPLTSVRLQLVYQFH